MNTGNSAEKVLVIDDEPFAREFFQKLLEDAVPQVDAVGTGAEGLQALQRSPYALVILDIRLPDGSGIDLMKRVREISPITPVIIITAYGTVETAVSAMKLGAFDFLMKPFQETEKVLITIKNAIYQGQLEKENLSLRQQIKTEGLFPQIIGRSVGMKQVFELIKKASEVESNVLIQGESGTGKELVARAVHFNSDRKKSVFLAVNCGALPESLLESTLFGYEKGAFTGAGKTTKGYFEEADGGSLFLDEIGEASPSLQVRLLRTLQEREVVRVGGTRSYPVDVRMILATNKDLKEEVIRRRFRKDLFYRINVIKIDLPLLRDKREDIPLLADHFVESYCVRMGKHRKVLQPKAVQALMNHDWPGNVRELQNVIERIVALHGEAAITEADIHEHLTILRADDECDFTEFSYEKAKEIFERRYLEKLLHRFARNLDEAARFARVHPATLYRKLKQYSIDK